MEVGGFRSLTFSAAGDIFLVLGQSKCSEVLVFKPNIVSKENIFALPTFANFC